ncbi:hypothetical protein QYM36_002162, partial [Artemia franciscana]
VSTAGRHILIIQLEGTPSVVKKPDSPLKYQHRCISVFRDKKGVPAGFAVGSVEGRVAIQYNNPAEPKDNFTFKCHRSTGTGSSFQDIFAVNSVRFHPVHGTLATAGSDGRYSYWDKDARTKLKTSEPVDQPVSAAAFNHSGHIYAYAASYDWSKEVEPKGIAEVLRAIENPSLLKRLTTSRLIGFEIEAVCKNLKLAKFQDQLESCLRKTYQTAPKDEKTGLKSFLFHQLFKSLKIFESPYIADTLTKEMNTFGWTELDKLSVNFDQRYIDAIIDINSQSYRTLDKNHIIDNVSMQLEDNSQFEAAFCTACQEPYPLCKSLCFLEMEYLIRSYHEEIADYHSVYPSDISDIAESLEVVVARIKRKIDFRKDFPDKH